MSTLKEAAGILQNNPIFQAMQTIVTHAGEIDQIDGQLSERTTQLKRADERLAATNKKIIEAEAVLKENKEIAAKIMEDTDIGVKRLRAVAEREIDSKRIAAENDRRTVVSATSELKSSNEKMLADLRASIRDRTAELASLETRLSSAREAARHLIEG